MASYKPEFKDLRTIICMQGYHLDYQFHIREIGFWSRSVSGVIPFNCKINGNELDVNNQKIIFYSEEELHGIKLKKSFENGLPSSEIKCVLKCIYHITKSYDYESTYIGICKGDNISGILAKAGLGKYVIEIDNLELFRRNSLKFPSNEVIRTEIAKKTVDYPSCYLHEKLKNDTVPLCSKAKAEYIAFLCYDTALKECQKHK
jgi:hypothetical protein